MESRVQAIDDSLNIGDTYESSLRNTFTAVQLFISLGFQVYPKKSMVEPTRKMEYLGFVLSSVDMTAKLTDKKVMPLLSAVGNFCVKTRNISYEK